MGGGHSFTCLIWWGAGLLSERMVGGLGRFLLTLESPRILKKKTFTPFCFSSKLLDLSFLCAVFDFSAFCLPGALASCTHASPTWPRTDIVPSQWPQEAALTLACYSLGLLTSLTTPFWKLFGSLDFAYFCLVSFYLSGHSSSVPHLPTQCWFLVNPSLTFCFPWLISAIPLSSATLTIFCILPQILCGGKRI